MSTKYLTVEFDDSNSQLIKQYEMLFDEHLNAGLPIIPVKSDVLKTLIIKNISAVSPNVTFHECQTLFEALAVFENTTAYDELIQFEPNMPELSKDEILEGMVLSCVVRSHGRYAFNRLDTIQFTCSKSAYKKQAVYDMIHFVDTFYNINRMKIIGDESLNPKMQTYTIGFN